MDDDDLSVGHLLLVEYKQLKQEQLARIGTRDNLMYVTLASIAAVIAATIQVQTDEMLLLVPPVCFTLGWTYLINDEKISAIGRYIRRVLTPQLETLLQATTPILNWESEHRAGASRRLLKIGQLMVDLMAFCVPGLLAVGTYLCTAQPSVVLTATAATEVLGVAILATVIAMHADLTKGSPAVAPT